MDRFFIFSTSLLSVTIALTDTACQAGDVPFVGKQWHGTDTNPLLTGRPGKWDALIRERGWIMKDGDSWKLWYTGYSKERQPVTMRMGLATSNDGINWQRSFDDPIYDETWIEDMMVVSHDGRYFMFAEGARDQPQMLESDDGVKWTRIGTLDVRQVNGTPIQAGPHGTPTVFVKDGLWHLFYERYDAGIWLAQSTDRKVWTNVSDDPLILPGPDEYDARMIAMNQVLECNGKYFAVLHGTGTPQKPRQWCTFLTTSSDLLNWTKLKQGPVLPIEENKSSGQLVFDGQQWRLYTMHAQVDLWQIAP